MLGYCRTGASSDKSCHSRASESRHGADTCPASVYQMGQIANAYGHHGIPQSEHRSSYFFGDLPTDAEAR